MKMYMAIALGLLLSAWTHGAPTVPVVSSNMITEASDNMITEDSNQMVTE